MPHLSCSGHPCPALRLGTLRASSMLRSAINWLFWFFYLLPHASRLQPVPASCPSLLASAVAARFATANPPAMGTATFCNQSLLLRIPNSQFLIRNSPSSASLPCAVRTTSCRRGLSWRRHPTAAVATLPSVPSSLTYTTTIAASDRKHPNPTGHHHDLRHAHVHRAKRFSNFGGNKLS
jgi:hypothetical protein